MSWHLAQVARALSRLLNALTGGEGDTTFSAYSYLRFQRGSLLGTGLVVVIDRVLGRDHCRAAYEWHAERRLFEED